jgi:hypothetical protein
MAMIGMIMRPKDSVYVINAIIQQLLAQISRRIDQQSLALITFY